MKLLRKLSVKKLIAGIATFIFVEALTLLCCVGTGDAVLPSFFQVNLVFLGIAALFGLLLGLVALWDWAS